MYLWGTQITLVIVHIRLQWSDCPCICYCPCICSCEHYRVDNRVVSFSTQAVNFKSVYQLLSTWPRFTVNMDATTTQLVRYLFVKAYRRYSVFPFSTEAVNFVGCQGIPTLFVHNLSVAIQN